MYCTGCGKLLQQNEICPSCFSNNGIQITSSCGTNNNHENAEVPSTSKKDNTIGSLLAIGVIGAVVSAILKHTSADSKSMIRQYSDIITSLLPIFYGGIFGFVCGLIPGLYSYEKLPKHNTLALRGSLTICSIAGAIGGWLYAGIMSLSLFIVLYAYKKTSAPQHCVNPPIPIKNANMSDFELNSEPHNVSKVSVAKSANRKYYFLILLYCLAMLGISIYWPYITDVYEGRPTGTKPIVAYHIVTYWGLWERIPDKVFVNQYDNHYVRVIRIDYLRLAISYVIATVSAVAMYAIIRIKTFFRN